MLKVEKKTKVHRDGRALFDTGSRGSYFSKEFAERMGYERHGEPRLVMLTVKGKYAKLVGYTLAYLEVGGYILPEVEAISVIEDLAVDAIIS